MKSEIGKIYLTDLMLVFGFLLLDGHSTETIKFFWRPNAVTVARNIELPQFTPERHTPYNCEKDYYGSKQ